MVMSSKQRDDLNWAIIDYLETHGFSQTSATLRKEANIDENADPNKLAQVSGLLEKKWTLTTRLQQKVLTLEEKLQQMDREAMSGAPTRDKRQPDEWIPRPPERYQLNGHRLPVTKVIFHPVFNVIASCSEDCTVKIWDFESGEFERSIKGHTDAVQDINFNASGKLLVSCSADMSIKIWDFVNSYECLKTLKGHDHNISSVTFLPSGDFVLSASRDKLIKLWDVANGYCVQNFVGHTDWVRMVRVNGTGSHFASCSNDKTIKVWSMDKQNANAKPKTLVGHDHVVESIFWVPDAFTASIVGADAPKESKMNGDVETPSVLISASRDRSIRFWDVLNCTCLFVLLGHDNWVRSVRVHPGGKYLISVGDDKTMRIWSMEHKRCIKVLQAHTQFVTSIDFHYKLPYVVTSSVDTTIKVWECR
ncbi:WD domain, g-beta repeat domain-containing protein [Ditylenchus destructor]|nr:WD domain, g-beta repeat domain-containing protein [Ditylenchus destructor]